MKKTDFHVHLQKDLPIDRATYYFKDMCDRHGYEGVGIMSLYYDHGECFPECNDTALRIKDSMCNSYAFASLLPNEDFVAQTKRYMRNGFDGIKLIRGGKPNHQRMFGHFYDSPIYSDFFALAEEEQIPILMHNNDPALNWDINRASQRAIEKGWVYDGTYPTHEHFYSVLESVLERFPRLNIALAHLGFYSEDLDRASMLLEKHPNLKLDITPALNIYFELSENREVAKKFFEDNSSRLIFGTDAENDLIGFAREYNDKKNLISGTFLTGAVDSEYIFDGKTIRPIALSAAVLEDIYHNNAMRFMAAYKK